MSDSRECCGYGTDMIHAEETGERIYPELCKCICHTEED